MTSHLVRRLGVLTAGALVAGGLSVTTAEAATSPSATLGASWLNGDLPTANYYTGSYLGDDGQPVTYDDIGLTIDTGLAAVASGNAVLVDRTRAGVAARSSEYTAFGSSATAKTLAFAVRTGTDPRTFGGQDLVRLTEDSVEGNGRLTGGNIVGQLFAAEGLSAVGSAKAPAAVSYLQGLQCASGAFGLDLPAAGLAPSCTDTSANPGADNTSLVGTALARLSPTASINTTIDRAAAFLVATGVDGSFGGGTATSAANSNSTGLAAALLGASCRVAAANVSADKVRALQVPTGAAAPLAGQAGAVAYDAAALSAARADGITEDTRDQFRRSTNQASLGLVWDSKAPASLRLTGPATSVQAGSAQTLTITGAAKGETVCLTTPTGVTRLVGTGAALTVPVTAPATGSAAYAATTGPGSATTTVTTGLLAKANRKKFSVGDKVKIKLTGLTADQKIVVKVRGKVVKKTRADGVKDKVTFRVPRGLKPGKATIKVKVGTSVDKIKVRIKR